MLGRKWLGLLRRAQAPDENLRVVFKKNAGSPVFKIGFAHIHRNENKAAVRKITPENILLPLMNVEGVRRDFFDRERTPASYLA